MAEVLVALGSNLGDRAAMLQRALGRLGDSICWQAVSPIYETAPMYVERQPAYLNAAARGETGLGPLALLARLKEVEQEVGRRPSERFGPREIDLDLIAYGQLRLSSRRPDRILELPHPRTFERRFVLAPLADVAPDWALPGLGIVRELLSATNNQAQDVRILRDAFLSLRR